MKNNISGSASNNDANNSSNGASTILPVTATATTINTSTENHRAMLFHISSVITREIVGNVTTPSTIILHNSSASNTNTSRHYAEDKDNYGLVNIAVCIVLGLTVLFFVGFLYIMCFRRYIRSGTVINENCDQYPFPGATEVNKNQSSESVTCTRYTDNKDLEQPFCSTYGVYATYIKSAQKEITTTGNQVRARYPVGSAKNSSITLTLRNNHLIVETEEHVPPCSMISATADVIRNANGGLEDVLLTDNTDDEEDDSDFQELNNNPFCTPQMYNLNERNATMSELNVSSLPNSSLSNAYATTTGTGYSQPDLTESSCSSSRQITAAGSFGYPIQMEYFETNGSQRRFNNVTDVGKSDAQVNESNEKSLAATVNDRNSESKNYYCKRQPSSSDNCSELENELADRNSSLSLYKSPNNDQANKNINQSSNNTISDDDNNDRDVKNNIIN